MLYVILFLGLLFVGIAFLLNEGNAHTLLAGYSSMSAREKEGFPLAEFLRFFKRFHLILGGAIVLIGLLLFYMIDEGTAGLFIAFFPIAAYMYFIWKSGTYQSRKGMKSSQTSWAMAILGICLVLVFVLFWVGRKENPIRIEGQNLLIGGVYGVELSKDEISHFTLAPELPAIDRKKHGFATGSQYKGRFKTMEGQEVLLILNSLQRPYIKIERVDGSDIYYSSAVKQNDQLYEELQEKLGIMEKE